MTISQLDSYLASQTLLSEQITKSELKVILREMIHVLEGGVAGDVVEFGCYEGTTSVHLQRLLDETSKTLWLYDSFEGLPEKTSEDRSPAGEQFVKGELHARKQTLVKNFKSSRLPLPVIKKAWFSDLTDSDIPPQICFAFLDGDYYDSILDPLKLIWGKLSPGAVVIVDDYASEALPGARRATDEWARRHRVDIRSEASLAIIRP